LDSKAINTNVAGSSITRSTSLADGRATSVSDFRHLEREVSAEEARAAKPVLDRINDDFAYVVGPPERKKRR
jgi:hypothetical protein